jgi:hypothetical protein
MKYDHRILGFAFGFLVLAGCQESTDPSTDLAKPPSLNSSVVPDPVYKPDVRESVTGKKRPSLAAVTATESVGYYNPETGTQSTYELDVDRDADGTLQRVNFPNSGWLEVNGEAIDNGDGTETFTDDEGREYTISKPDWANEADNEDDAPGLSDDIPEDL